MATPCHILVEGNPVIIYASRNGTPQKVLSILNPFIEKFWQEREISGEDRDTPGCLVAQIVVRFGYEICEDDFSNLRVSMNYDPGVEYLYWVSLDRNITVWLPEASYRNNPSMGLQGCRQLVEKLSERHS
ncbi:MAG: hypothetical protein NVS2B14_16530 [Chamaesiphon sp.]